MIPFASDSNYNHYPKKQTRSQTAYIEYLLKRAENSAISHQERLISNKEAFQLLVKSSNDSIHRSQFITLTSNFYYLNSWNDLKASSQFFLKESISANSEFHVGKALRAKGLYFENTSVNDSAFYYYKQAEKIFRTLEDFNNLCGIYYDQAQVLYYINDYLGSEKCLVNSLRIAQKAHLINHQFCIYSFLGINSTELTDYDKAFEFHMKSLQLVQQKELRHKSYLAAVSLNNMGYNYIASGNPDKAIEFLKKALAIEDVQVNVPHIYVRLLDNLAYAEFKEKKTTFLPNRYFESTAIREKLNIQNGSNYNKLYLSEYYASVQDTFNAILTAKDAVNLSKKFRAPKDILFSLKQLARVDARNALHYTQQYMQLSDSMQILERANRNKFAKIEYETEEITQQKDIAIQQKKLYSGVFIGLLTLGILLFIIKMQHARKKELQLQQIQQNANEEIYHLLLDQQNQIDLGRSIEKKRIAQELHDGIMNKLSSTRLNLHLLAKNSASPSQKKTLEFIEGIRHIEKEIRCVAHGLSTEFFANKTSFIAIIDSFVEEQKLLSKVKCHVEIDPDINWQILPGSTKIHIFRILQEAFQNINKHSKAKNVIISIFDKRTHSSLEIYDDGIGFSLNGKKKGIGLQNIYSRAKSCNGMAEIKTHAGAGTTIIVTIPNKSEIKTTS